MTRALSAPGRRPGKLHNLVASTNRRRGKFSPLEQAEIQLSRSMIQLQCNVCELQRLLKETATAHALGEKSCRKLLKRALDIESELFGDTKAGSALAEAYYPGEEL